MEYSGGRGNGVMGGDLEFFGVLARPKCKEPFVVSPPECDFGGCRTRPFVLDGREVGGGD